MADPLSAAFVAACPAAAALPDLAAQLAALVGQARAEHPGLVGDGVEFAAALARRVPDGADLADFLAHVAAADLALACACARGDAGAIAELERRFARDLDRIVRRFEKPSQSADDLRQILRERLLVATELRPPRIADYTGQGFLANWLKVTAVRTFIDLDKRRARAREALADDAAILALPDPAGDLELDFLKREYRAEFGRALAAAAGALEPGDRNLLRQHLGAGLGIDQLAGLHGIHRATAARRLARAREALLVGTRAALMQRLSIDEAELDSIMTLIASRLDVSLARLLSEAAR